MILEASNLTLTEEQASTVLTAAAAAAATTLTVESVNAFPTSTATAVKFILLGEWGDEDAEIVRSSTATPPSGTTITLVTNVVAKAHAVGTKVTSIDWNKIEFSRATTSAGDKTQLGSDVAIHPDNQNTTYNDLTNSTGYWYFRFTNDANSTQTYTSYSGEFPYAGLTADSVGKMKEDALGITNETISDLITEDFLLREANNWQREIQRMRNWNWELTSTTDTVISGEQKYAVPTDLKHVHEGRAIVQMRIRNYAPLVHIDKREWDDKMVDNTYTTLAAAIATDDTTATLTDSSDFGSSGTITVQGDDITFTANDTDTNILTITASTISEAHSSGDMVYLSTATNQPEFWTLYEDYFYLQPVPATEYDGYSITIDYHKTLSVLTTDASTTEIPFYYLGQYFLAWKIEIRKSNQDRADYWRQIYENRLAGEIRRDTPAHYYRFTLASTKGSGV